MRNEGWDGFPFADSHLLKAVWRLCCAVILSWGAFASTGGDWFAGAPGFLRVVVAAIFFAVAVGMVVEAISEWKKFRARGAGPGSLTTVRIRYEQ